MIAYPVLVGARTTRVLEAGSGDDHLVLLHGLAARADRWRRNLEALSAAGYHVFAYDHPGHGFSTKGPDGDYTVPGFASFLEAFLEVVGIERAALVGTSFGGAAAATFTIRHPARVKALMLVGSVGLAPTPAETRGVIRSRVADTSLDGIRRKLGQLLIDPSLVTEELVREEFMINNSGGAREAFERLGDYMAEGVERDLVIDHLAAVGSKVPVLLLWGAMDRTFPVAVAEAARDAIPGSMLALISGAGHAPYYEKPEAFNAVVLDFLAGRFGAYRSPEVEYP
jgi:pimeloyl-ACP methyl ester carboxylesterase